jgi:lysozyme family protein
MTFDKAFELLMVNEVNGMPDGGYVNNPADPGGETKYGISKRSYTDVDIAGLTEDDAKAIYQRDYWDAHQCGDMPWPVGWTLFDCAVNHGAHAAVKWLQGALSLPADGVLGLHTLAAATAVSEPLRVARDITLARDEFAATLSNYATFKHGWKKRFLNTLIGAVQWTIAS